MSAQPLRSRRPAASGRYALPGPAGTGRPLRLVPGRGVRSRCPAGRPGDGGSRPPRLALGSPHPPPRPHRRRGGVAGRVGGKDRRGVAVPSTPVPPVAAGIAGTPGRRGRHLPAGLGHQPAPSPPWFRWYRAMPLDAAIALPDGRSVAVVRQGNTSDRTAFAKRLWRLGQLTPTSAVLMLLPDEVRLRQARRLAARRCPARCSWPWRATPLPPGPGPPSGAPPPVPRPWTWQRRWPTPTRPGPGPCGDRRSGPRCPTPWTPGRRLPAAVFAQAGGEAGR